MKLADWLRGNDPDSRKPRMRRATFAARIGASDALITAYCDGSVWPGRAKMEAIIRETGGQVTANDFLQSEAAQ